MKRLGLLCCSVLMLGSVATAQMAKTPTSPGGVFEASVKNAESEIVSAAEAMPEDKYSFVPASGEFKGVRTYAQQIKHVAAVNYMIAAALLGEKAAGGHRRRKRSGLHDLKSGHREIPEGVV